MKYFTWIVWMGYKFFNSLNLSRWNFERHISNEENRVRHMMDGVQCVKDERSLESSLKFDE